MNSVSTANTKEDIDISTMSKNVSILVAITSLTEGSTFTWKGKVIHKPGDRYIGCFIAFWGFYNYCLSKDASVDIPLMF